MVQALTSETEERNKEPAVIQFTAEPVKGMAE
jgi:hypothetical protein